MVIRVSMCLWIIVLLFSEQIFAQKNINMGHQDTMVSKILGESRVLNIALPYKYHERVHSYPVIFVLDGDYLFGLTQSIAHMLASRSQMPQSIIVGISPMQQTRRFEMDIERFGGQPKKHLAFIEKDLIPYMEKHYRVNNHRTLVGLSPSNGLLFETIFSKPNLFKGYIALSTHFEWDLDNNKQLDDGLVKALSQSKESPISLYMARAGDDINEMPLAKKRLLSAQKKLNQHAVSPHQVKIEALEDDEHYTVAISGIKHGLNLIYPKQDWKSLYLLSGQDNPIQAIEQHYKQLSQKYGIQAYPLEDGYDKGSSLRGLASNMARWKRLGGNQAAIKLLRLALTYYPNSAQLHYDLAQVLEKGGQTSSAKLMKEKAMELEEKFNKYQTGLPMY